MECLVCKRKFSQKEEENGFCPLCGFPVVEFLDTDVQKGITGLKPQTEAHRKKFISSGSAAVRLYLYDTEDGRILSKQEEEASLGTLEQLSAGVVWTDIRFEQVFEEEELPVLILVQLNGKKFRVSASVKNLPSASVLELGASLDENFRLHLYVRGDGREVREAEENYYLFAEECS